MALTYSVQIASGSTNGRPIELNTIASPGTTIHTVQATATTGREEIMLYAYNDATATMPLNIEFGGTASADRHIFHLPSQLGYIQLIPRWRLTGTDSIVRAYSTGTATDVIRIKCDVDRAT